MSAGRRQSGSRRHILGSQPMSSDGECSMRLRNRRVREFDGYADDDDFVVEGMVDDVRFDDDAVEELFEEELLGELDFDEWEAYEDPFVEDTEPWDDVESVGVCTYLEWSDDESDDT